MKIQNLVFGKKAQIVCLLCCFVVGQLNLQVNAEGVVMNFANREALRYKKILKVGQVEVLEFQKPVSLAHYGTSEESLNYIELDKLEPEANGYKKFLVKAKRPGYGELTFRSGTDLVKLEVIVQNDYQLLEKQLNDLFGMPNASYEERITVTPATHIGNVSSEGQVDAHIYLKGKVANPKNAMLAVAFAANAVNDHGVKIFSNPGGQLRAKDLDSGSVSGEGGVIINNDVEESSFAEYYETTNALIDTDNLYRDLVLASEHEHVISFLRIAEPSRYAVKVRFLELDSKFVDTFVTSMNLSQFGSNVAGAVGSTDLNVPVVSSASDIGSAEVTEFFSDLGILDLRREVRGGNIASGVIEVGADAAINLSLNDLMQEGILRVVNEFSLVTHSGERISLGKGMRFPLPQMNNNVGGSTISVEYMPIGFKGELKVTGLDEGLIDVQLASRLSASEPGLNTFVQGFYVPVFREEFVNSGALVKDGQEVILNTFLTEAESVAKATSFLGRIIPFIGKSKKQERKKNLLFIALKVDEIEPTSKQIGGEEEFQLPRVDLSKGRDIYQAYQADLRAQDIGESVDISELNRRESDMRIPEAKDLDAALDDSLNASLGSGLDPLDINIALPGVE